MSLDDVSKILGDAEWITTMPAPGSLFEMVHECEASLNRRFGAVDGDQRSFPVPDTWSINISRP